MKIALLGATGQAGSRLAAELAQRGHEVTAIARHPEKLAPAPGLRPVAGDVSDATTLVGLLDGHDAVVSALRFESLDTGALLEAVKRSGVPRFLVIGGAGSLHGPDGQQLVDAPDFPAAFKAEALPARAFLTTLRTEPELDWTYFSPSAHFAPGERTGHFRLGTEELLVDRNGKSAISMEDAAIALADELEQPLSSRCRFTAGY